MGQVQIEKAIGLTQDDAEYINSHRGSDVVEAFCSLLGIESSHYDVAGFALLECALEDVRAARLRD